VPSAGSSKTNRAVFANGGALLRTGVSTSNTGAVLDGDLDEFMAAALAQKAFGEEPKQVEDVD
jgi:hypothetical protein